VRQVSLGEGGRIRVGFGHWTDLTSIAAIVEQLGQAQPAIRVELRQMSLPDQIAAFHEGRLDVGFVRRAIEDSALESERLRQEPLVVVLPSGHRLAARRRIGLHALAAEPFVLLPRAIAPRLYDLVLNSCRECGFVPRVPHEADHPQTVLNLVAAGIGVSLVPESAGRLQGAGLVFRPLRPALPPIETFLICRKGPRPAVVDGFLEIVRRLC
jgi:DNA-binding transcriptional LysR family regulator